MSFIEVTQSLLGGFAVTCLLFILTLILSLPLGLLISFCTMSKFKPLKFVFKIFVWIIRGVPLMLQIFIIYFLVRTADGANFWAKLDTFFYFEYGVQFGKNGAGLGAFIAVLIAFAINYACYFSEIFRGGIESISKGQHEAGMVLGLTKKQIFSKIILLQVIKRIVPPMSNEIITLVKDTALSNSIGIVEIILQAKLFTQQAIWPLFYSGVFYLIFVGILTLLFGYLEKKLSYFKA
ncbi:MAG: amino acid ABC transporter permease [Clostridia bacterium]|nr:amino acid ABC transporter permease [Clostridia bacterium]